MRVYQTRAARPLVVLAVASESEASYARLIALGTDGYMSSEPSRLAPYLCANGIPRPDGSPRC
jgi:hypothetical protein